MKRFFKQLGLLLVAVWCVALVWGYAKTTETGAWLEWNQRRLMEQPT